MLTITAKDRLNHCWQTRASEPEDDLSSSTGGGVWKTHGIIKSITAPHQLGFDLQRGPSYQIKHRHYSYCLHYGNQAIFCLSEWIVCVKRVEYRLGTVLTEMERLLYSWTGIRRKKCDIYRTVDTVYIYLHVRVMKKHGFMWKHSDILIKWLLL